MKKAVRKAGILEEKLARAMRANDIKTIKKLAPAIATIENESVAEDLMWMAYDYFNFEIVKILSKNGVKISKKLMQHMITDCARTGNLYALKFLVESGADRDDFNAKDGFPLIWSARLGFDEIVEYLVENGADVKKFGDKAIKQAEWGGYEKVVNFLKLKMQ